jgi:hypothetical protein
MGTKKGVVRFFRYTFLGLLAKVKCSTVSVLISLISDTRVIDPNDINQFFQRVRVHLAACCLDL